MDGMLTPQEIDALLGAITEIDENEDENRILNQKEINRLLLKMGIDKTEEVFADLVDDLYRKSKLKYRDRDWIEGYNKGLAKGMQIMGKWICNQIEMKGDKNES